MNRLLPIAMILGACLIVMSGYAWAGGKTCQEKCYTQGKNRTCTSYCWP